MEGDRRIVRLNVSISFDEPEEAHAVYRALKVDDDDFLTTSIDGTDVRAEVRTDSIDSARRAADDWLACLMAIKKR